MRKGKYPTREHRREFNSHRAMIGRCYNPANNVFHCYGGRGIKVCDSWRVFDNFMEDMGTRPAGKSLDRIDTNGDYCPENCRWVTQTEQMQNTRTNVSFTFSGKTQTASAWARELGINYQTLMYRYYNNFPLNKILGV